MEPTIHHAWHLTEPEAIKLQKELSNQVITNNQLNPIKTIAGVDVAYDKNTDKLVAAIVILDAENLEIIETATAKASAQFPYIPGLFSFREIPALLEAFKDVQSNIDLIICDAQGYAHPRRFGLACHLGVLFDIPTIGCCKTKLIGEAQASLDTTRGSFVDLIDNQEIIGRALRVQDNLNPVYVSIGHKIDLDTACDWVLKVSPKYRLPETTRQADQLVKKLLKN